MAKDIDDTIDSTESPDEFLQTALSRYESTKIAWSDIFDAYSDDFTFVNGDMWDGNIKRLREQEGLSTLNVDKITPKVESIVNNIRSNMPAVKIHAVDNGASENTAKVFDGVIRTIEYQSNAKEARINGHRCNVIGGIGAWRILPVEEDDGTVELKYERILDPTTVLMDPSAKEQDFSDAEYCFYVNWMSREAFKRAYPKIDPDTYDSTYKDWYSDKSVQVVEYWCKNEKTKTFEYYLLNADNILEENKDYPGKYVPFMYVTGKEFALNGEREYKGVVRSVKDSQILHNLVKARTADFIARSAEPQWLAEEEQIADHNEWDSANINGSAVLTYTGTSSGGKPQRIDPLQPPTGLIEIGKESDEDIRVGIGVRDPSADIPASQSGKAIALQISQGNIGTFEFADKLNAMIKYEGRVLIDLIPHFYSYPHIRAIMGLDGKVTPTQLNKPFLENGEEVMHDLSKGKYMVTVSVGPSYESQRSEGVDRMIEVVSKWPQMMEYAGDIIVGGMDFPGAEELSARLKAAIPPQILAASDPTNGDKPENVIAQLQGQLAQLGQQMQELQMQDQACQQENQQLKQAQASKQAEIQGKAQADLQVTQAKAQADAEIAQGKFSLEMQMEQFRMAHEEKMYNLRMQHEKDMAYLTLHVKDEIQAHAIVQGHQAKMAQIAAAGDVQAQLADLGNEHKKDQQVFDTASKSQLLDQQAQTSLMLQSDNHSAQQAMQDDKVDAEAYLLQLKIAMESEAIGKTGQDVVD